MPSVGVSIRNAGVAEFIVQILEKELFLKQNYSFNIFSCVKPNPKKIPFEFVFDYLLPLEPVTRPMFGCFALYVGEKIVLILRERKDHPEANGVWLATSAGHHESLKKEFPSMRSVYILSDGKNETGWQMLPSDASDFESSVIRACELVRHGDKRIGKIPKRKERRSRK